MKTYAGFLAIALIAICGGAREAAAEDVIASTCRVLLVSAKAETLPGLCQQYAAGTLPASSTIDEPASKHVADGPDDFTITFTDGRKVVIHTI